MRHNLNELSTGDLDAVSGGWKNTSSNPIPSTGSTVTPPFGGPGPYVPPPGILPPVNHAPGVFAL